MVGLSLNPHPEWHSIFEAIGYVAAYLCFRALRQRSGDVIASDLRWNVLAAAALGALVGSRLLEYLHESAAHSVNWSEILTPTGGKTVVGGLLGGWLAVEILKKIHGIDTRTGDLFAIPLCVGIAIGRIGCFLAGLSDDTYGLPTSLPWGVNFGDGIPRHPTQLYEIVFLSLLGALLWRWQDKPHPEGMLFRRFLACYLAWRLLIDFLKPAPLWFLHLSVIQWACAGGLFLIFLHERTAKAR